MSYSQAAPPHERPSPDPDTGRRRSGPAAKRPGTVLALLLAAIGSAISALIGAILVFSGGNGLAETNVNDVIKQHPDALGLPAGTTADDIKQMAGPLWQEMIDDRAGTLSVRAGFAAFVAVCMLLSALFARKGAGWARVLITVWGLVGLIPHLLVATDYEPASVTALSWIALVGGVAAVVLCWMPGVRRFGKDAKAAKAARAAAS